MRHGPVEGKGEGLIARDPIEAGEVVVVWGGASYGDRVKAEKAQAAGIPTMQWDKDLFSIAGDDHPAFAINHSCDPNVWMDGAFTLRARRDIEAGEEITVDYAMWLADEDYVSPWECRCGMPNCRGRITGRDWRLPSIHSAYRGHFSPWIEDRVKAAKRRLGAP